MKYLQAYSQLTKTGIIIFALVSALAGYAVSYHSHQSFTPLEPILLIVGLYLIAAASFALNQAQEWRQDALMERTRGRPIPTGFLQPCQAYFIAGLYGLMGLQILRLIGPWPAGLALLTVILYNGVYTLVWKRHWVFGAVPGAIPGAMPVVIGYSVNNPQVWNPECVYLFLVMFLWQMPHFWALAIRFREDYQQGGFPVLPVEMGETRTRYYIGLYLFTYVGVALAAPWFVPTNVLYFLLVLPISLKVILEFRKFYQNLDSKAWLPFFLWTNFSILIYLAAPVMDKWLNWAIFAYV